MDVLKTAKASHEVSFLLSAKKYLLTWFTINFAIKNHGVLSYSFLFFEMALFFIDSKENLNIGAVRLHFHSPRETFLPERLFDLFLLTLCISFFFSTVQGCPACHGVRRTRRKVFREESERVFENNNNKQTSTPSKHLLAVKNIFF